MTVNCENGASFEINGAAVIFAPTASQIARGGEMDWREGEYDRAWVFCHPGALVFHPDTNEVVRIKNRC